MSLLSSPPKPMKSFKPVRRFVFTIKIEMTQQKLGMRISLFSGFLMGAPQTPFHKPTGVTMTIHGSEYIGYYAY